MATTSTNNKLFIVEVEPPFERKAIQFVPESIKNPRTADISTFTIIGRNDQLLFYVSGQEKVSMELEFYSDEANRTDVIRTINWLKSLTINNGKKGKFSNVRIVFGDLFKNEVFALQAVDPDFSHFDANNNWLPMRAKCRLEFILDSSKSLTRNDIRKRV